MSKKTISDSSKQTVSSLLAVVGGASQESKGEHAGKLSRLAQAALQGTFLHQLQNEWSRLMDKGMINKDFEQSETGRQCALEMYRFLDDGEPNQGNYDFVSRIFFNAAIDDRINVDKWLPHELIRIASQLDRMEVRVLTACYTFNGDWKNKSHTGTREWRENVAEESKIDVPELIDIARESLTEKKLIESSVYPDGSGIKPGVKFGLTRLGFALCQHALYSQKC